MTNPTGGSIQARLTSLLRNIDRSEVKEGDFEGPVVKSLLQTRAASNDSPLTKGKYNELKNQDFVKTAKRSIQNEIKEGSHTNRIDDIKNSIERKNITNSSLARKICLHMTMVNSKLHDLQLEINLLTSLAASPTEINNKQQTYDALNKAFLTFLEETETTLESDNKIEIYDKIFRNNKGLTAIDTIGENVQSAWKNISDDGIKARLNEAVFTATADIARRATDLKPNALSAYFDSLEADPDGVFVDFERFFDTAEKAPDHLLVMDEGGRSMSPTGDGGQVVGSMNARDVSINTGTQNAAIAGTGHIFHGPVNIYPQGPIMAGEQAQEVGAVGGVALGTSANTISKQVLLDKMIAAVGEQSVKTSEDLLSLLEDEFTNGGFLSTSSLSAAAERFADKLLVEESGRDDFIGAFKALMENGRSISSTQAQEVKDNLNKFLSEHFLFEHSFLDGIIDLIEDSATDTHSLDLLNESLLETGVSITELKLLLAERKEKLLSGNASSNLTENKTVKISELLAKLDKNNTTTEAQIAKLTFNTLAAEIMKLDPYKDAAINRLTICEGYLSVLGLNSFNEFNSLLNEIGTGEKDISDEISAAAMNVLESNNVKILLTPFENSPYIKANLSYLDEKIRENKNNINNVLPDIMNLIISLPEVSPNDETQILLMTTIISRLDLIGMTPQELFNIFAVNRFFNLDPEQDLPLERDKVLGILSLFPDDKIFEDLDTNYSRIRHDVFLAARNKIQKIYEKTNNPINIKQGSFSAYKLSDLIDSAKSGHEDSVKTIKNGIRNIMRYLNHIDAPSSLELEHNFTAASSAIGLLGTQHFAEKFHYDIKNALRGKAVFEPNNVSNAMINFRDIANLSKAEQATETLKLKAFIKENLAGYSFDMSLFQEVNASSTDDEKADAILSKLTNKVYPSLIITNPNSVQAGRYSDYLLGTNLPNLTQREEGVAKRIFDIASLPDGISSPLLLLLVDYTDKQYVEGTKTRTLLNDFYKEINTKPKDGLDGKDGAGAGISSKYLDQRIKDIIDANNGSLEERISALEQTMQSNLQDVKKLRGKIDKYKDELMSANVKIKANQDSILELIAKNKKKEKLIAILNEKLTDLTSDQALDENLVEEAKRIFANGAEFLSEEALSGYKVKLEAAIQNDDKNLILQNLKEEISQRMGDGVPYHTQIDNLKAELQALRNSKKQEYAEIENKLKEQSDGINKNKEDIESLNGSNIKVDDLERTVNGLKQNVVNLTNALGDFGDKVSSFGNELNALKNNMTTEIKNKLDEILTGDGKEIIENIVKDLINSEAIGTIPTRWVNQINNQLSEVDPALGIVVKLDDLIKERGFSFEIPQGQNKDDYRRAYSAIALNYLIGMLPNLATLVDGIKEGKLDKLPDGAVPARARAPVPVPAPAPVQAPPPQDVPLGGGREPEEAEFALRIWSDLDMGPANSQFSVHTDLKDRLKMLENIKKKYVDSKLTNSEFSISLLEKAGLTSGKFLKLPHLVKLTPDAKETKRVIQEKNIVAMNTGKLEMMREYPDLTAADYTELDSDEVININSLSEYAVVWLELESYAQGSNFSDSLLADLNIYLDDQIDSFLVSNLPSLQFYETRSIDEASNQALPLKSKKKKYQTVKVGTVSPRILKALKENKPAAIKDADYVLSGAIAQSSLCQRWLHAYTPSGVITKEKDPLAPFAGEFLLLLESNFDPNKSSTQKIGGAAFASPWAWAMLRDIARVGEGGDVNEASNVDPSKITPHRSFAHLLEDFKKAGETQKLAYIAKFKEKAQNLNISPYQLFDMQEPNRQRFPLSENQTKVMNHSFAQKES